MKKYFILVSAFFALMLVITPVTAMADATANAGVSDVNAVAVQEDNSTTTVIDRKFAAPGITPIPATGAYVIPPSPDSSYRKVADLLEFSDRFTEGAIEKLAEGGSVAFNLQIVNEEKFVARAKPDKNGDRWIRITTEKPDSSSGFKFTGFIDGEAKIGSTNMFQVIGQAAKKAMEDGNNVLYISKDAFHRCVEAYGWGVGFYGVSAEVSVSGGNSHLGGGGTGYAFNQAGPEDKPWFQGFVGVE